MMSSRVINTADNVVDAANAIDNALDVGNAIDDAEDVVAAGANLIGSGDQLGGAVGWVKPEEGFFDVLVHGSPDSFHVLHNGEWVSVDHRTLATFIQKNGWSDEAIRLLSCSSGASPTGVAQNLANKLGVTVKAPSDTLWIFRDGKL
jgi:hypothetical protein